MPKRQLIGGEPYRYGYQGEFAETDPETGKPAFELRLYDPRINRWLTTDPAGQYSSPYLAMGNNWINKIDPDGGEDWYVNNETGELEWHNTSASIDGLTWVGTNSADFDYLSSMSHLFGGSGSIPGADVLAMTYYQVTGGFNDGLSQRGKDFAAWMDNPVDRTLQGVANTIDAGGTFINDFVASGESDLGYFAMSRAYDTASNMTLYDWSYAAGYSAPDIALGFAGGYALSGLRGLQIGFNTNWRLMRSYNYAGGNIKFQIGIRNVNTNYHFRFERHRINGKFNTHFNYGTGGRHHWPPLKN